MEHLLVLFLVLMLCLCIGLSADTGDNPNLPTKLSVQTPPGKGPFPCVIICPGRGYHMELPLMKDLAEQAVQEGFVAIRFDWTFFSNGTNPSQDGMQEYSDVEQVIQMAKQLPEVDSTRIYLAGKSLGSIYAYVVFHDHPELKGCLLMTPVIPGPGIGDTYYPDLANEYRKVVFILGNEDFNNCKLNDLYDYIADCKAPIPVVVLAGGHGFNQAGESTDKTLLEIDKYNIQTAVNTSVYWLKTFEHPVYTE